MAHSYNGFLQHMQDCLRVCKVVQDSLIPRTGYRAVAWAGQACESAGVWISPDGRLSAVNRGPAIAGTEGDCLLWDFSRGSEIAWLKGFWAQFSADSRTLFTFARYDDNRVQSYDVSEEALANPPASWHEGTLVYRGRAREKVNTGALAADGRTLVIAATDSVIFLDTLGQRPAQHWGKSAHILNLSHDGRWIATMLHHHMTVIWSTDDGRATFRAEPYSSIEFSPDNRSFSVATRSEVQIYALDSMRLAYAPIPLEVRGSAPPVAFSRDGRMFVVALERTNPRLFETASGRELAMLSPPHPAPIIGIEALKFSADGKWLLAAKTDDETVAWSISVIRGELAKLNLDWSYSSGTEGASPKESRTPKAVDFSGLFARPPRDPATPPRLIDLSRHYNALLTEHWHEGEGSSDLSELPHGVQTLAGVPFDLRGLIQVGAHSRRGEPYPREVAGVAVGLASERLHFLHAAIFAFDPPGTQIGNYVVRYAEGQTHEIPIVIGRDLADWWSQDVEDLTQMQIAWSGQNESSRVAGRTIRLFKTTWENPRPAEVIQSLDFVTTNPRACPFLVAVTADEYPPAVKPR